MSQLALMIDLERCTGCKSCEAACKQANGLGPATYRNRVTWFENLNSDSELATLDFLTVTCQQCERPACVRSCPVNPKAIQKDAATGIVQIDESVCTGCGECAIACPYGAIGYDSEAHHAVKCDLCAKRRADNQGPACAAVCPTRAITFGERNELEASRKSAGRQALEHDLFLQKPQIIYLSRTNPAGTETSLSVPALISDHQVRQRIRATEARAPYLPDKFPKNAATQVIDGGCHICFNACPVQYHLVDGQIHQVFGNPNDSVYQGRVCPKSQMTLQTYRSPQRLLRPLRRTGQRGTGAFEAVSWDQALDEIASRLLAIRDEYGAESLAIQAGSRTGTLNLMGFIPMFAGLWGTPNTASTEPFCDLGKSVALELTQGSTMLANVYTEPDIGSASLYVYIGDNQAETRPVHFGMVNEWRLKHQAKMVVIDPRLTPTASKADKWFAIRPGTDMALGLALVHEIFANSWHDESFCRQWIVGWTQWRDFINTENYSANWAAPIVDIPAAQITELAKQIAQADGCMLFLSRGVNQHTNSAQTNRVFMFLAAITGNWGRRGGGFFNVNSELDWQKPALPADRMPAKRPAIAKNPAGWVPAMLAHNTDGVGPDNYPIRALITGNNPLGQWPDQATTRRAFANLDLVVHLDLYQNATSAYADFVLPMSTGIEKGGTSRFSEDRRIIWNDPLIAPPGEAKSDHWFWIELGKRLGFDDILKDEYKDPALFWDAVMQPNTPTMQGITIEKLRASPSRSVRVPLPSTQTPDTETLFQEGTTAFGAESGKRFATPSGKLEFYTDALEAKFSALGLSSLPQFYGEHSQLFPVPPSTTGARG